MNFDNLVKEAELNGADFIKVDGVVQSVNPPETLFGMTYWSHCIPPVKPDSVLILGYGGGTVAKLIRKIWGDVTCLGVDIKPVEAVDGDFVMVGDAKEHVKSINRKYEYILIDLFNGGNNVDFLDDPDFVSSIRKLVGRWLCVNISPCDYKKHVEAYSSRFNKLRADLVGNNVVEWWGL